MAYLSRIFTRPLGDDEEVPEITDYVSLKSLYQQNCHNDATLRRILLALDRRYRFSFMTFSWESVPRMRLVKEFIPELTVHEKCTLLSFAGSNREFPNNIELLCYLFEELHIDPNISEPYFMTPFESAIWNCNHDTIVCYLEHGADPNKKNYLGIPLFFVFIVSRAEEEDERLFFKFFLHGANIHECCCYERNLLQVCYFVNRPLYAALAFTLGIEDTTHVEILVAQVPGHLPSFLMKVNNEVNRREKNTEHRFLRTYLQQNSHVPFFEDLKRPSVRVPSEFASLVRSLLPA